MTPRGAEALIDMRKAGKRPAVPVFIQHGHFREPDWWKWADSVAEPEILIRPEDPLERLDLRCLIGLRTILFVPDWDNRAARLYERIIEYVEEVCVLSPAFDLDIGWIWNRRDGRVEYSFQGTN